MNTPSPTPSQRPTTPTSAPSANRHAFDLTGPLPAGTTVLGASAGTGKTYTIAGLVTRWVAETGLRLPQLLVVTFTRAATAELRDRVRRRIVTAGEYLETPADQRPRTDDGVLGLLADAPEEVVDRRRERLARALTDIDAATISTIHGFCQHVLDGLGVASDLDRDAELIEDRRELIEEVVDDLLVDAYVEDTDRPRVARNDLLELAKTVVANPATRLEPRGSDDTTAGLRLHLATRIRREVAIRSRRRRQMSYDDLLTRLDATLADPERGPRARKALRDRYRVVLIDEFQDTDPVQWSIVARAFADTHTDGSGADTSNGDARALVLIGDPKQAIYSFRGADVYAYLKATDDADTRCTLDTSWRADAGLLTAFDTVFHGARFGEDDIAYRHVDPAPGHDRPRLVGAPETTPLRLRLLRRFDSLPQNNDKVVADKARQIIAADSAADIVRLLDAEPSLIHRDTQGNETDREDLKPRHVAVLARSNAEAGLVQEALHHVEVPAVISGVESVFATPAAGDWQRLLDALERPASTTRVRALATSEWIGWTGDDIAGADEEDWDALHDDVHRWARRLREDGVAAMQRSLLLERSVRPRLLAQVGGERRLADLEHIAELVHTAAITEHLGPATLADWLREQIDDADNEQQSDKLRRLETDDQAVQILTVHSSKGLEFPVVYCPYLWTSNVSAGKAPVFHDNDRERRIDVGGDGHADYDAHKQRAEHESRGEHLRLLYVAMTRAKHQVVASYAPAGVPEWSGLARLLLCRGEDGSARLHHEAPLVDDEAATAAADRLAARSGGTIAVEHIPAEPSEQPWQRPPATDAELGTASFDRGLDLDWRRTSYSALTRLDEPQPHVSTEPDEAVKDDEELAGRPQAGGPPARAAAEDPLGLRDVELPLAGVPGGTGTGTFVHRVLEHVDFAADDLDRELRRTVDDELRRRRLNIDAEVVTVGLRVALRTPLGGLLDDLRLAQVTRDDRRDEVDFELPLDRGDGTRRDDTRPATVTDLARLLDTHLDADDPLADYTSRLPEALLARNLRGYLGGSIDLVLRRVRGDGTPVFYVADYKTNWLGVPGRQLTAWHYRPTALAEAMMHGHYPLQALLYTVAVHRTLRWRVADYDPSTHLGGVLYLFVRGMAGPSAPVPDDGPCGVFAWTPPAALIEAASDLLHGAVTP